MSIAPYQLHISDDHQSAVAGTSEGFFQGAHHFNAIGCQFIEINHCDDPPYPNTTLPPLPPLKLPSASFTGRDEYLQRLKLHFSSSDEGKRKVFLLHGLGGIGKTQICLKFIEENADDLFSDVFWIVASSESNIELGLKQIAQAHNASPEVKASAGSILQWISNRTRWLIVYDGADGHYSVVEKYLPPGKGGNILITSRNAEIKRITLNKNSMEVLDMVNEEAIFLLLQSAMLDEAPASDYINDMARMLVSELGGIPLAIDQAGGYMHSCGCSINDYLELYAKHQDELMSNHKFRGASDYGTSTYETWDVAMHEIERIATRGIEREAHAAQSAINLLRMFAFLDHTNIPEELFKNAAENYMERNVNEEAENGLPLSVKLLDHKALFLSEEGVWDKIEFLYGIQVLLSFSLIKSHNHLYSMHQLVNAWNRSRLPKGEISDLYQKARAVLSCSIVPDHDIDTYTFCQMLVPHLRSSTLHALEMKLESTYYDDEYERFSFVFDCVGDWNAEERLLLVTVNERNARLGYYHLKTLRSMSSLANTYRDQGRWGEAEKLQLEVMDISKSKLGLDHTDTLLSMNNLASIYIYQGRWDEAERMHLEVMNTRKIKFGLDNQNTLQSMNNLVLTYSHQGRWDEAEKLQLEVMDIYKSKFGLDHPKNFMSMYNLAKTYCDQGRWDEAEKLQLEAMDIYKPKFGLNHPYILASIHNLAMTYINQGRWGEAEKLQLEVLDIYKLTVGLDHPNTLLSMNNLAQAYSHQGRWDEAEKLQLEVMNISKTKLGLDHPNTFSSMNNLAKTYCDQGRWDEAEKLLLEVMGIYKPKFGLDHPNILMSMNSLATTYSNQGRLDEAEKLLSEAMGIYKPKFGLDHPNILLSMNNLAMVYSDQGRWDEGEKLLLEVMNISKTKLGLDHPNILLSTNNLALAYNNQGRWDEAEKLLLEVMNISKTKLGLDHPNTLLSMNNLALAYSHQGRWDEAEELQLEVMNISKTKLGLDHPNTLLSMNNLATTYCEQERWDEAEKLLLEVMDVYKSKFGLYHPTILPSMGNLAMVYCNQGRLDEAEKLQVETMETSKTKLGLDHPDTLIIMANLAGTYRDQGRWDEAQALLSHTVKNMQQVMGHQHPHSLHFIEVLDDLSKARDRMNSQETVLLPEPAQSNDRLLETTSPQHNFRKMLKKIWRSCPCFM